MTNKKIQVPFSDPINSLDTELQTFGCRHSNPEICGSNGISDVCAFASEDCICKKPSRAWKKQFSKLKEVIR